MDLSDLPPDILIPRMTYLSPKDISSLCQSNKRLHEICTSDKYKIQWKMLIENTYGNVEYYKYLKRNPNLKYNYQLYLELINWLPYSVQLKIYERINDKENFARVAKLYILSGEIQDMMDHTYRTRMNKFLDISNMDPITFEGIKIIYRPTEGSRKIDFIRDQVVSSDKEKAIRFTRVIYPAEHNLIEEIERLYQ